MTKAEVLYFVDGEGIAVSTPVPSLNFIPDFVIFDGELYFPIEITQCPRCGDEAFGGCAVCDLLVALVPRYARARAAAAKSEEGE